MTLYKKRVSVVKLNNNCLKFKIIVRTVLVDFCAEKYQLLSLPYIPITIILTTKGAV